MGFYIELTLVALVTIYCVDISGFTQSWRDALARKLKVARHKPLPPFDCGKCMTWWVCNIYALCTGHLSMVTIALAALFSLLSIPLGQAMIFIREWLNWIIQKLMPRS